MHLNEHVPFKVSVFSGNIEFDPVPYIEKIKNIQQVCETRKISNRGGWQSKEYYSEDLEQGGEVEFVKPLIDIVGAEVANLYKMYGFNIPAKLSNLWFNVNKKYNYNASHTHQFAYLSGVIYFKVPSNSGFIVFERPDPSQYTLPIREINERNWLNYYLDPSKQNLAIFPSYLSHSVEQNLTDDEDDERISMAFNFV